MAERIPQSTAFRVALKAMLAATPTTPATGLSLAVVLSTNCSPFANPAAGATTATEIELGWYYVDLSATDTGTLGPLIVRATQVTIVPAEALYTVVNAHNGGYDGVPDAAADASGGLSTTTAQAGDAMTLTAGERSTLAAVLWAASSRTLSSFGSLVADVWSAVVDSAGVATLLGRLTSTRSGLLDHLDADVSSRLDEGALTPLLLSLDAPITSRAAPADVLAQVRNALDHDTYALPGQEELPTSPTLAYILRCLYNHAETTVDQKAPVTQDATTFVRGRFQQGP